MFVRPVLRGHSNYDESVVSELNPETQTDMSEDGVDLTLIRWMLSLTPAERLEFLQGHVRAILAMQELNAGK